MLFAELVATSAVVAATRSRAEKIAQLAALLARLAPDEIAAAVAFLSGELPGGRIGVGGATVARAAGPGGAAAPPLAIGAVRNRLRAVPPAVGAGPAAARPGH